jgi:hemoglobin
VNRALCLGVGALYSKEKRIAYDLFVIGYKELPRDTSSTAAYRSPGAPSLYERLGEYEGLRRIVADFFDGLTANPQLLRQNPEIAVAYAKADPEKRDRRFAEYLGMLAGGPGEYTGQPLDRVHAPMGITEADWTLGAQEIVRALNKNKVSKADQNELFALVEPLKPQIVQGRR